MKKHAKLMRLSLLVGTAAAHAAPNLVLHPTRVVFEKNQRSAQLDLSNTGDQSGTYRIKIENKRMDENGKLVVINGPVEPGELFAADMIQYSPRQVELAPGAGQTVRLSLRKPANLAPGEYRSHIFFERIPDANTTSLDPNANKLKSGEIGIVLTALVGISIPVIVRHGDTTASAKLSELKFSPGNNNEPPLVTGKIEREGNQSLYGDVVVKMLEAGGREKQIALASGIAIYVPNVSRKIKIPVQPEEKFDFSQKTLRVIFRESESAGGKALAEANLVVAKP